MKKYNKGKENNKAPNVVMVVTDDQGWGDLSFNGNKNIKTPKIDSIAEMGAVLNYFYVQPVCAPTRAELLTGRYFPRTGVRGVTRRAEYLNLDEKTIGDVFIEAGYATGCFGKWHNGSPYPYHPNGRGFDEFFGFCCGHWGHYYDTLLEHNGKKVKNDGYIIDNLTNKAMRFIEKNQDNPFFCYIPYNIPHSPFQVPDKWYNEFKNKKIEMRHKDPKKEDIEKTRAVLAMCKNIDWNVGRLQKKIKHLGLRDNTIFIYFSDNGPNTWRWNGRMRGKKGSTEEGGVRSPCFISWPGKIEKGIKVNEISGVIDLLPTLTDLCELKWNHKKPIDGKSLAPLLLNKKINWPKRNLFSHSFNGKYTSIRTPNYRAGGNTDGLFNLQKDPEQTKDISSKKNGLYLKLKKKIKKWEENVVPDKNQKRFIPVGYPQFPQTDLNAQDGEPSGSITWSSVHPNASYFINWNDINDDIYWEIDIKTSGYYLISLFYTCTEGDEGSKITVSFKNNKIATKINKPFDPPIKNNHDRVKRVESYEKEFKKLTLGELYLPKDKGKLRLYANSKSRQEICHVRRIKVVLQK